MSLGVRREAGTVEQDRPGRLELLLAFVCLVRDCGGETGASRVIVVSVVMHVWRIGLPCILTGSIPSCLGELTGLVLLSLSSNSLSGESPVRGVGLAAICCRRPVSGRPVSNGVFRSRG